MLTEREKNISLKNFLRCVFLLMLLLLQLNDERTNFYVCMEMNNVYTTHPTTVRERNIAGVPFILSKLSTQCKNDRIPKQNFIISVFVHLCSGAHPPPRCFQCRYPTFVYIVDILLEIRMLDISIRGCIESFA